MMHLEASWRSLPKTEKPFRNPGLVTGRDFSEDVAAASCPGAASQKAEKKLPQS